MKTLWRDEADELWQTYWDESKVSFFKIEALQDYSAEEILQSRSYIEWLNGNKARSLELMKERNTELTKQTKEKPIFKQRIHIVNKPYTSYLEWEILHYKYVNIPYGGEEVFLLDTELIKDINIPGDFMIFDDSKVANSHYNSEGLMVSRDFYNLNDDISEFLNLKKLLLSKATRLEQ